METAARQSEHLRDLSDIPFEASQRGPQNVRLEVIHLLGEAKLRRRLTASGGEA